MNMQAPPAKQPRSLALGIERLGLVSLRFPAAAAIILIILAVLGGFGVARLKVDDSLSQLFRSNTPEYRQFEETVRRFPSSSSPFVSSSPSSTSDSSCAGIWKER